MARRIIKYMLKDDCRNKYTLEGRVKRCGEVVWNIFGTLNELPFGVEETDIKDPLPDFLPDYRNLNEFAKQATKILKTGHMQILSVRVYPIEFNPFSPIQVTR